MRHLLDQTSLDAAVAQQLQAAPAMLGRHVPALYRILRRDLLLLPLGDRVQPSADDPLWARRRAARHQPVHRLGSKGAIAVRQLVSDLLFTLERLALTANRKDHPFYFEIVKKLRGIPHWKIGPGLSDELKRLPDLSTLYGLQQLCDDIRHADACAAAETEPPTPKVRVGRLVGTRHRKCEEILALGREANNCLLSDWRLRKVFSKEEQIWALRSGDNLVAVLSAEADGRITEILGPRNRVRLGSCILEIAAFVPAAGLTVGSDITVRLADLVPEASVIDDSAEFFDAEELFHILHAA